MKTLTILGCAFAGGVFFGLAGVMICQICNPLPKFCGLMLFYASPFGAIAGAMAGANLAARDSDNQ